MAISNFQNLMGKYLNTGNLMVMHPVSPIIFAVIANEVRVIFVRANYFGLLSLLLENCEMWKTNY
jgi:hypothetical protein